MFELELSTPSSSVSYRDGSIKIKVKINVLIKSSIIGSSGFTGNLIASCEEFGTVIFQKTSRITDETILEIDFKNDLGLHEITCAKAFVMKVDFIDDATNKIFSGSINFDIEMSDYFIKIVHSPQFFKPRIPYGFTILVTSISGYPVVNSSEQIEIIAKDDDGFILVSGNFSLASTTGSAEILTEDVPQTAAYLTISAKYDKVKYSHFVPKTPSFQNKFISMNVLTPM